MCISAFSLATVLPYYYTLHIMYSCTCGVSTISILNLAIFSLLLKSATQKINRIKFFDNEF
jgi:hypothetical protein